MKLNAGAINASKLRIRTEFDSFSQQQHTAAMNHI